MNNAATIYAILVALVLSCAAPAQARSRTAVRHFEKQTGYPHGRPGYVVDHWLALACGGSDTPANMNWQTIAEAKAKDRKERTPEGCEYYRTHPCPDCGK